MVIGVLKIVGKLGNTLKLYINSEIMGDSQQALFFCSTRLFTYTAYAKILVGFDFTMMMRYEGKHELYFSVEYCTVISDAQASEN